MQRDEDILLELEHGGHVRAKAPMIVSASRSTDIPAYYSDWFFHRLQVGYSVWKNPFNGQLHYIDYRRTRFIIFWSKNPRPLLLHLGQLEEKGIRCYVQYTLNDYEAEGLEPNVPPLAERIETFRQLVDCLGKGHVIWRFDPLLLTDQISMADLLERIRAIGDQLQGYTEKLVFSFADISTYSKVRRNLDQLGVHYREFTEEQMLDFARQLSALNERWGYELATCGEAIDLSEFGIRKNHCVDDRLMVRLASDCPELMDELGARPWLPDLFEQTPPADAVALPDGRYMLIGRNNSDKGQRLACGCMRSKDIGQYDTCPHLCAYCYANTTRESALAHYQKHLLNPHQEMI